ncbi:MAG TPA: hypothetical protein VFO34_10225 [Candidatus Acidoferrales bacterium]|nr:hypothetical protein [Candidatus Acidoferrales bacterium]
MDIEDLRVAFEFEEIGSAWIGPCGRAFGKETSKLIHCARRVGPQGLDSGDFAELYNHKTLTFQTT